eukprot:Pgem_evm1s931
MNSLSNKIKNVDVNNTNVADNNFYFMPDETSEHSATWMSYVGRESIWGNLATGVKANLVTVANVISQYEKVNLVVDPADVAEAQNIFNGNANINMLVHKLNDFWIRDYGAVYIVDKATNTMKGIDFNFNGWGNKTQYYQPFNYDKEIAKFMAQYEGIPVESTFLVMEGGDIEVDGFGTGIFSESAILNDNRNPGVTKENATAELKRILGLTKVLWVPGIKGREITDGHVDFYARFMGAGVVAVAWEVNDDDFDYNVTRDTYAALEGQTDALGNVLQLVKINNPDFTKIRQANSTTIAAGYINFYTGNGFVIMPQFGDNEADQAAFDTLTKYYSPKRKVIQVNIDDIALGGGGIHCSTQQNPIFPNSKSGNGNSNRNIGIGNINGIQYSLTVLAVLTIVIVIL